MDEKIKVAMVTKGFEITGISTVILNYCKALNHTKFDLTVIAGEPIAEENRKKCKQYGIKLIELPSRHQSSVKHYMRLWKEFKKDHYDIIHVHGNSSLMAIELTIAKIAGCKITIAHSHNSYCPNMLIHKILNPYFRKIYTKALACSLLAGDWLFGKKQFEVLPNGFCTKKFIFDSLARRKIRKELQIENKYVIGYLGRFNEQKNQTYLLKIFEDIAPKRPDAVLLLVGTGPDLKKIQEIVKASSYQNRIIIYGVTPDTQAMYSAMDVFVLPSKYEGLPVVLLEAQISGLPCIVSDRVTKEMDFEDIIWESIECDPEIWSKKICEMVAMNDYERYNYYLIHKSQIGKFDINNTVEQLDKIYQSLMAKE